MISLVRYTLLAFALCASFASQALTLDDAKAMIACGDLEQAHLLIDSLATTKPKDAEVDYVRGELYLASNNDSAAITAFTAANKKGANKALLALAEIATRQYRVDDAMSHIDAYKAYITKNKRKKLTDESAPYVSQITRTRAMLDRVERIVVIDSITIDKEYFLEAYRLSPEAGSLSYPDILPEGLPYSLPTVVYTTEDGREMIWGTQGDDTSFRLQYSNMLSDNTWEESMPIGDHLGAGGDANYPFLMPDGVTLYFASDNEASLGGLDIFISRNNGTEFLAPQNLGMPYNSPYDDYMLAIDEMTGAGWWATDRNRLGDLITIYVFIPSNSRANISPDDPALASLAMLTSIADTQDANTDYTPLHNKIAAIKPIKKRNTATANATFEFALPDGRIITDISQFSSSAASDTMGRYLQLRDDADKLQQHLDELRKEYASGNTSVAAEITHIENEQLRYYLELRRIANDVIKAEMGGNLK